ncbi:MULTISPECIES: hypothetical protein [Niallia]|uniref:Uncharacterized protein n=1 Tax=Niallia taxi TaxID=2499688 RepID=A0A437K7N5_9BACI|nr:MULTISPECIES: hypothetical protein [Niallia]MDK8643699.1 hypothetical protein [Niallia taxi]RVT59455.1 hypothetical protein EM808_19355 [Niallia taxi]UPO91159.1 hypothetical protein L8T27_027995 [Niallia sp. Man26]GKU84229.1 hypothetical protein NCCP28_36250 [Niallia sp. NCCP-28]
MKKTIIYSTASVLLISLFFHFNFKVLGKEDKLLQTIDNLQSINANIAQWSIFTKKEEKSDSSLKKYYESATLSWTEFIRASTLNILT